MKALLRIFRPSRKLVLIIGGIAFLGGTSGGAALYIGKDTLLGPPAETVNGAACTDVNLVTIKKQKRVWVRKYIKTDGSSKSMTARAGRPDDGRDHNGQGQKALLSQLVMSKSSKQRDPKQRKGLSP